MKWEGDAESSNVEDSRGMGGKLAMGGGGAKEQAWSDPSPFSG